MKNSLEQELFSFAEHFAITEARCSENPWPRRSENILRRRDKLLRFYKEARKLEDQYNDRH